MEVTNNKTKFLAEVVAALLILLWVYTAGSKVLDFEEFRSAMANQVFSSETQKVLLFAIPAFEFATALMLVFDKSKLAGFILSLMLLTAFTIYIILIISNYFPRVPCGCGGVLKSMGWRVHLIFNSFFLFITSIIIFKILKERRQKAHQQS